MKRAGVWRVQADQGPPRTENIAKAEERFDCGGASFLGLSKSRAPKLSLRSSIELANVEP